MRFPVGQESLHFLVGSHYGLMLPQDEEKVPINGVRGQVAPSTVFTPRAALGVLLAIVVVASGQPLKYKESPAD